ncbi:MAG TPA: heavy-metal-associated domain-containing protein [Gemmataceae bacterium]|nr:heavy-metal-associated domain-containing protein [Gemmataceae bacterium]
MRTSVIVSFLILVLGTLTQANNQTATTHTVIEIEDFDCEACGVVVELSLIEVPGVAKVKLDFDNETATVIPHEKKTLSPKALWEAVEEVGFKPTKLVGPGGTFLKKPSS